eukprot:14450112-Heterocapsa_arctica.AAC.1
MPADCDSEVGAAWHRGEDRVCRWSKESRASPGDGPGPEHAACSEALPGRYRAGVWRYPCPSGLGVPVGGRGWP